jgi:hypothetical protein
MKIVDSNGVLEAYPTSSEEFNATELAKMINEDGTVNIDAEGITHDGELFWICTEGSVHQYHRRINFVFKIDSIGAILDVFTLPAALNQQQNKGLEGIAFGDGHIFVTMQKPLKDDTTSYPLVLRYNIAEEVWVDDGVYYPTDEPESQNYLYNTWEMGCFTYLNETTSRHLMLLSRESILSSRWRLPREKS